MSNKIRGHMSLEALNQMFLWASVAFSILAALWALTAFPLLAALSAGAAILSGRKIDQKNRAQISELQPRYISTEQRKLFTSVAKGDGTQSYKLQVCDDKTSIESGIYAGEIKEMLSAGGWIIVDELGYATTLIHDKPGIVLIYDSQNPPSTAAVLERGLRAAKIFSQENPRWIGVKQPLFIMVNSK